MSLPSRAVAAAPQRSLGRFVERLLTLLALLVGLLQLPLDRLALRLTLLDLLLLELCFGHSGAHGLDATPRQHQRRKQGDDASSQQGW